VELDFSALYIIEIIERKLKSVPARRIPRRYFYLKMYIYNKTKILQKYGPVMLISSYNVHNVHYIYESIHDRVILQ
jgi:hypothetical protein